MPSHLQHMKSTGRILHNRTRNDMVDDCCPPSHQKEAQSSSSRPSPVEAWLESVGTNCQRNDPRNDDDFLGLPLDETESQQTPYLLFDHQLDKGWRRTWTYSPELFVPTSPYLQDNLDVAYGQKPGDPDLDLPLSSSRSVWEKSRDHFDPVAGLDKRSIREEFHRQPRRKTRDNRYDTNTKHQTLEGKIHTDDKLARRRGVHKTSPKQKVRSGKEIMKKFATDAINKEYIVMKPQVVGESLPEDRRRWRKNTALTDLSFHQFELGLSNTRLSTFDAADIDSRSRRSTIQPESAALSPVEGISQEDLGDGLSLNHNPLASVPDPITTRLSHACTSFRGNEVDSESAASLVRAASPRLKIETAQNADSPSPVWQKSQHKPHIRFTHPRRYNMDNSPSMRSPGQLELSCLSSPPPMKDQNINETLSPELYNNSGFVPQLRSSDLSRADLGHLCHKHDRARYDDGTYYGDELMMSELVSPQFHQARDSSGDVTARRSPRLQFTAFQSPVMQGKVGVEGQSSRRFAHDGSQWVRGDEFAHDLTPLLRTEPVSPTSWAESIFPCIGLSRRQTDHRPGPSTSTSMQFSMEQPPNWHASGTSEMIYVKDDEVSPHVFSTRRRRNRISSDTFNGTRHVVKKQKPVSRQRFPGWKEGERSAQTMRVGVALDYEMRNRD